jgi:putative ABC transport system permease protein
VNLWQTLRAALRAILRNKLRSFLTTLGIVIGVGAVIAMMALGAGARADIEANFAAMGTNLLIVLPGSTSSGGLHGGFGSMPTMTNDDMLAIGNDVASVKRVAPVLRQNLALISEESNWTTSVTGTTPDYFAIRNWAMETGTVFTTQDVEAGTKVVVLGRTVADKLFGVNTSPIGQAVRIGTIPFDVVAVAVAKGQSSTGQDFDDVAFIPATTYAHKIQGRFNNFLQGTIYVEAVSEEAVPRAQKDITALLRDRHHVAATDDDDFSIRNMGEVAAAREESTRTMTTLLASVAAVSLLVGGIGIMNIMLVSVTERTREIGLRMALGAKPHNILSQFLIEAVVLSVSGGALGIALGVGAAHWMGQLFHSRPQVQPEVIVASVVFSATVGIVFGLYPAQKASRLDPIDALRYE